MRDSERNRVSISMDDLIVRTIGAMDTLPDRLNSLEKDVRVLEKSFSRHEGGQDQGIKRISDRMDTIENSYKELHKQSIEKIKSLRIDVGRLKSYEGLTPEQEENINNIQRCIDTLLKDYNDRQEVKKTIWHYVVTAIDYFVRYAMLPVTIAILLFLGFDPSVIPGFNPDKKAKTHTESFNEGSVELMSFAKSGKIEESSLRHWMKHYDGELSVLSTSQTPNPVIRSEKHFFIWLPNNSRDGYVQMYGDGGRKIGTPIIIERGK
jgi:archaellum component FlaC